MGDEGVSDSELRLIVSKYTWNICCDIISFDFDATLLDFVDLNLN